MNHPVAFIDAWTDDLADEPFVALVWTLRTALKDLIKKPKVKKDWNSFINTSGKVASIVALGAAKRGAAALITAGAVKSLEEAIGDSQSAETLSDGVSTVSTGVTDDLAAAISQGPSNLASRLRDFEAGKNAIRAMKDSLSVLVDGLPKAGKHAPVIIIIDELDRCRPSYAIKLLEEIKHLFDVPGIVFIFGMHANQLAHSVQATYGNSFNGSAYLKRFINRKYFLSTPSRDNIVKHIIAKSNLSPSSFVYPRTFIEDGVKGRFGFEAIVSYYLDKLDVPTRDLFEVFDILETSSAVAGDEIMLPYILPLIIARVTGVDPETLSWANAKISFVMGQENREASPQVLFDYYYGRRNNSDAQMVAIYQSNDPPIYINELALRTMRAGESRALADFRRYEQLINALTRQTYEADIA